MRAVPGDANPDPTLFCVAGEAADATCELLRSACLRLGVGWQLVRPLPSGAGTLQDTASPKPGDLLVVAGAGDDCQATADRIWLPGVVSLQGIGEPARVVGGAGLLAAGIRMPASIDPAPREGAALAAAAEKLGGYPVLLRLPGGEGGRGVMRVDSLPSLVSVRDALPDDARLVEYVPHDIVWRIVAVGNEVIAAEAWRCAESDFRSNVGGLLVEGRRRPAEVDRMALAALGLLGLQFGGVDVMEAARGTACVAEVNSPCWFVDTQQRCGVDIAGRIVERLLALRKAAA